MQIQSDKEQLAHETKTLHELIEYVYNLEQAMDNCEMYAQSERLHMIKEKAEHKLKRLSRQTRITEHHLKRREKVRQRNESDQEAREVRKRIETLKVRMAN